jgi:hypothetical protein
MASKPSMKKSPTFPLTTAGAGSGVLVRNRHGSGGSDDRVGVRYSEDGLEIEDKSAPDFCSTLSDAIAKAFENVTMVQDDVEGTFGSGTSSAEAVGKGQKKKRKNKGKMVFSTGGAAPFNN